MENNKNIEERVRALTAWIREWFRNNGPECNAVIGMSGGKDSTIVAKLCADALGNDRVIGVLMPQGKQSLNDADRICEWLGIRSYVINIREACDEIEESIRNHIGLSKQTLQNIPPRVRMTTLYAVSQSSNGRVIGTTNLSEFYVGYLTRYGDGGTDVEPIGNLTVTEVLEIGDYLGIPYEWVHKTPDDGLPHSQSDEEKLGFTYKELDDYILYGIEPDDEKLKKIIRMHDKNAFKMTVPERFLEKK